MDSLENQRAADKVAGLYQDLEERLMANIIRHIKILFTERLNARGIFKPIVKIAN